MYLRSNEFIISILSGLLFVCALSSCFKEESNDARTKTTITQKVHDTPINKFMILEGVGIDYPGIKGGMDKLQIVATLDLITIAGNRMKETPWRYKSIENVMDEFWDKGINLSESELNGGLPRRFRCDFTESGKLWRLWIDYWKPSGDLLGQLALKKAIEDIYAGHHIIDDEHVITIVMIDVVVAKEEIEKRSRSLEARIRNP